MSAPSAPFAEDDAENAALQEEEDRSFAEDFLKQQVLKRAAVVS